MTKKLLYIDHSTLVREIKSLLYLAAVSNRTLIIPNVLGDEVSGEIKLYNNRSLWPGFRVARIMNSRVEIVEPAYYWRIAQDYKHQAIPRAKIVLVSTHDKAADIKQSLLSSEIDLHPRVVLASLPNRLSPDLVKADSESSAEDSVGIFKSFTQERKIYRPIPFIKNDRLLKNSELAESIIQNTRLCAGIFEEMKGNRSCFDKCK